MSGIYIHIPFCSKRCNYCDFYLITNLKEIDRYLSSLRKEILILSEMYEGYNFDTIFFGGGTPSVLTSKQIEDILNCIQGKFSVSSDCEITLEANPEDLIDRNLKELKDTGVNRLSLGIQSFDNAELKFLTRQHTGEDAVKVIEEAKKYFDNISVDIIYSLPNQKVSDIDYSLTTAINLNLNHISAYTLTYEAKTVLYKSLQKNLIKKNTDTKEAEMYSFVSDKLISAGYEHYEVSNFAKNNFYSRHNKKYWEYENYLGLGPSAHSFFNNVRWNNFRSIEKYNDFLDRDELPAEEKYEPDINQRHLEFVMLSLRSGGINFKKYYELFNEDFRLKFSSSTSELIETYFAEMNSDKFYLTEKGYALADEIIAKYF